MSNETTISSDEKKLKAYLKRSLEIKKELEEQIKRMNNEIETKDLKIQTLQPLIEQNAEQEQKINEANEKLEKLQILYNQAQEDKKKLVIFIEKFKVKFKDAEEKANQEKIKEINNLKMSFEEE